MSLDTQHYLSAQHISTNLNNYEAARTGFFTFIIGASNIFDTEAAKNSKTPTTINGLSVNENGDLKTPSEGLDANSIIQLNVIKASVPHFSIEALEYKRGNETIKFAGMPSFEAGSIVVDDVVGLDTKSILMAWHGQAYDVYSGKGGRMKDYKKNCQLVEYTQDYVPIRTWDMVGCWISEISEDDFDKESDGKRQITCTIQYDKALPTREKASAGGEPSTWNVSK
jgi:hypothetical protein